MRSLLIECLKLSGELLNGVIDAGHGLKRVVEALASELPNNTGKGQEH